MGNEVYTDLENQFLKEKHETLRMEVIEFLVKTHSDDSELGKAIREFVNIKENTKNDIEE